MKSHSQIAFPSRRNAVPAFLVLAAVAGGAVRSAQGAEDEKPPLVEISADELRDRIHGGVLGQMLGNLNGLPHEFKYIDEPGDVKEYTPGLPEGAHADDDTDIEWVYIIEMQRTGKLIISPKRVRELWLAHINDWIWASNDYSRQLMDLGLEPPLTGHRALNPWAGTNVAGLYMTEMFSLAAPAMPATAAELGAYYAHASVDGEPIQAAQLFSSMIALAYVEHDIKRLIEEGRRAVDPHSEVHEIVAFVVEQHKQHPEDWRVVRRAIRDRYTRHGGVRPDINGYALNTAAAVGALLYGQGDFVETLKLAFNFGWDADNTAAVCGSILGAMHGRRWMERQGWQIVDRYRNDRREGMPTDETISGYSARVYDVARQCILQHGGEEIERDGKTIFRIARQQPRLVEKLPDLSEQTAELIRQVTPTLERDLTTGGHVDRARAVYLAIRLGLAEDLRQREPGAWRWGVQRLERFAPGLVIAMFKSPRPDGDAIRQAARDAGVLQPKE